MRIDVVGSVLRIIFQNEDRRIVPVRAMRDSLHDTPDREIVIGDRRSRRGLADARSAGVIVGQVQQDELRQLFRGAARLHKAIEFPKEFIRSELVGVVDLEIRKERILVTPAAQPWSHAHTSGGAPAKAMGWVRLGDCRDPPATVLLS